MPLAARPNLQKAVTRARVLPHVLVTYTIWSAVCFHSFPLYIMTYAHELALANASTAQNGRV